MLEITMEQPRPHRWIKVLDPDALSEGQVTSVCVEERALVVSLVNGRYGVLDAHCPHQGGPLAEGCIVNGQLMCPLHHWKFDPHDGSMAGGLLPGPEAFEVESRTDGVYVAWPGDAG